MAFEKYKAKRAATRQLHTQCPKELELAYLRLCKPSPPSYDEVYDSASTSARTSSDAINSSAPKFVMTGALAQRREAQRLTV